ncbi:ornithine carbamoyltransferase [Candidatus Desantisbacteria bacterium CG1_02_38_46]|uniref:Ornithine carbamoyltransferase n=3 Tax=unclassified Candidatus Desantisiibacteriota TaxID=3106372 RepID=A0A2H9PDG4_9BACT|nr:MAG: ornithine carbamoyltransferase [Candidatus Desantisbacteria bacterium CG1_02_38_46]PIU50861.1 MAG: ornithine carbamoyltransferase [Candidatus Desantisbacteria bacterium CG07_land_8_20_14_0_80_39_15]PIZ16774.1 MAG: ornithine carbamoyltransferase [Candidatus Desantisbacteria bacterium CG_4_10_14_0_8_um_filter_39_17]
MEKNLISIYDLTVREIKEILEFAIDIKKKHLKGQEVLTSGLLKGKILGLIFQKPSTRTRVSFEAGMKQLGGETILLDIKESQLSRGETIADTAKVISKYLNGIVVRGEHKFLLEFAKHALIPVINGLTEVTHPCQILSDLLTISESGKNFKNLKLVFVGDGNNICNSLMFAAGKLGIDFIACCPAGYEPGAQIIEKATKDAKKSGGSIDLFHNPAQSVKDADVIYTDTWVSMGQETEVKKRLHDFKPYQVNKELLKYAKQDCVVLHCLPAHRGQEITSEVLDGKNSIIWEQAENRLHVQKAILILWLGNKKNKMRR